MLKVDNIVKYYGKNCAVNGLSFEVKDGEIFGLLGENGAGKTTTFRIIMGLLNSDGGTVLLNDKKIDYSVTNKIGYLTEERSLLTKLTVKEQIVFYGILKGMTEEEVLKKLDFLLKEFGIEEYKNRKIKELSKGNQQKIQFIAAVINVDMFKKYIRKLQKNGCSIIFSSHQMEHIEEFCEKLIILVKGKSILDGYVKDIKQAYKKKNIIIAGNIDDKEIKKIDGVINVEKRNDEYLVKIENKDVVSKVFKTISKYDVNKFIVEEATLNEIFIAKVGEAK